MHTRYFDKITDKEAQHQQDYLPCAGEIDQIVYTRQPIELSDPQWNRRILIETTGSSSIVLWNPGTTKAQQMQDLPENDWQNFFCVEAANAAKDARYLQPGAIHTLSTRLHTIPL
jgi:glucose-6-phosphate 1-epimerase